MVPKSFYQRWIWALSNKKTLNEHINPFSFLWLFRAVYFSSSTIIVDFLHFHWPLALLVWLTSKYCSHSASLYISISTIWIKFKCLDRSTRSVFGYSNIFLLIFCLSPITITVLSTSTCHHSLLRVDNIHI